MAITIKSLNIDNHFNQICQYGAMKTEVLMFLKNVLPPIHHAKC